jgi:hypothetical protein
MSDIQNSNDAAVDAIKKRIDSKDDCCHVADDIISSGHSTRNEIITDNKERSTIEDYAKAKHSDVLESLKRKEKQKEPSQNEIGGQKESFVDMLKNQKETGQHMVRSPH